MTNPTVTAADDARRQAATLLAEVARGDTTPPAVRLHCLAAVDALDQPTTRFVGDDPVDPAAHVRTALRLLGRLPRAQFAQPSVLTAARHARQALRGLR